MASLKNETGMEIKAYQTPLARVHLRWMEDYRLDSLVEMYHQERLQDYLAKKVEWAENTIALLMKDGRIWQQGSPQSMLREEVLTRLYGAPISVPSSIASLQT